MTGVSNVNTTDIRDAIRLGCRTMSMVFNAGDGDVPFFASQVRPDACMGFSRVHSEAHVPGRHLNALLSAEDAAHIHIDEDAIDKHARAAFLAYSGPLPLPLNRETPGGSPVNFLPHNVREGFHTLYAQIRYRESAQARLLAEPSRLSEPHQLDCAQPLADSGVVGARPLAQPGLYASFPNSHAADAVLHRVRDGSTMRACKMKGDCCALKGSTIPGPMDNLL